MPRVKMRNSTDQPGFLKHACIATRMIDKRRQLFDLQEQFNKEKVKYDKKNEILLREEEEYKRQDFEFQHNLLKFEAFAKNNASTR